MGQKDGKTFHFSNCAMECKHFLEKLASDNPMPGGGSASALAGALSASLVAMVAGLTLKKGGSNREEMKAIRRKALAAQRRLCRAMDEDMKYYGAVLIAFQFPKSTEKECSYRSRMIQKAYQKATITLQLVCKQSLEILEYCRTLTENGNPNAVGDTGVAALLADAAFSGGLLDIRLNLAAVTDKIFLRKMDTVARQWVRRRDRLMEMIKKSFKNF